MDIDKLEQLLGQCRPLNISPLSDKDLYDYAAGQFNGTQRIRRCKAWGQLSSLLWTHAIDLITAAKREQKLKALLWEILEAQDDKFFWLSPKWHSINNEIQKVLK